MKGFVREETRFSLCGLNCCLCSMHLGGYCPGCGGGAGNQSCAIAKCSLEHGGVLFCWACPEYPCSRYEGFDDGDSFVPHRNRRQDIAQAREMGLEAYLAQLEEKRAILDELLAGYNDGRRKTPFCAISGQRQHGVLEFHVVRAIKTPLLFYTTVAGPSSLQ